MNYLYQTITNDNSIDDIYVFQHRALGDNFFIQKIIKTLASTGKNVIIPIEDKYEFINNYLVLPKNVFYVPFRDVTEKYPKNFNSFYFISEKMENKEIKPNVIKNKNIYYVPLAYSWHINEIHAMQVKYQMLHLSMNDWSQYFTFKRDIDKENELYYNVLKLKDNEKYIFRNRLFDSKTLTNNEHLNGRGVSDKINISSNVKIVDLQIIEGFTPFDWCKVFENATAIFGVETSIFYIMETLKLKAKDIWLFTRRKNTDIGFEVVKGIFKNHPYKLAKEHKLPRRIWNY